MRASVLIVRFVAVLGVTAVGLFCNAQVKATDGGAPLTAAPDQAFSSPPQSGPAGVPLNAGDNTAFQPLQSPVADGTAASPCIDDCEEFCDLNLCSPPGRFWLRADYLMWWTSGTVLPPLVTSNALSPTTTTYYGNGTYLDGGRSGYRTTVGTWLDCCHIWNAEVDYLSLGEQSSHFSMTSSGDPTIARPFYNTNGGVQDREWIAYPGVVAGTVTVDVKDYFQSAGFLASYRLCAGNCCNDVCTMCDDACDPPKMYCCRTDLLAGFRYYSLSDRLGVHEDLTALQTGWHLDVQDHFSGKNDFYGSEIGLRSQIYRGRWSLELTTKIAIGNTQQTIGIDGQTVITASTTTTYPAGLLASGYTNGQYSPYHRDVFTVIPELRMELGYQWSRHLRTYFGYNLLYWGDVARAADQIDLIVDSRNIPPATSVGGLPFPAYQGRTTSFWAQGVNLGAELRF